ncbi:MAG: tol-pal system protein YbgF [Deltaproteobacteria bacterium]|nr:tol-pal system protein YbgF [Deltaproteobacteria bacterium]
MGLFFSTRSFAVQATLLLCFLLFCSSCVTQKEFLYLNDQIVALNKRVDSLQEIMDRKLSTELDSRLMSVREEQAKAKVELHKVREDMQGVSDRLDENNRLVRRAVERDTTAQDDMNARVVELQGRVSELEAGVKRLNVYLNLEPAAGVPAQDSKKGPVVARQPEPPAQVIIKEPTPVVAKPEVSPEKRLYDLNLALYREERYEEAIAGFKNFLVKYPKSELADNAQFWVGESYMALKQYEQAILAFQRVIKKYPKGNKVPNAILRQALAFYEIKDKTSSRLLLKKVIRQFPKSSEAKIARGKLKAMK